MARSFWRLGPVVFHPNSRSFQEGIRRAFCRLRFLFLQCDRLRHVGSPEFPVDLYGILGFERPFFPNFGWLAYNQDFPFGTLLPRCGRPLQTRSPRPVPPLAENSVPTPAGHLLV